jgi:hypothetical protein
VNLKKVYHIWRDNELDYCALLDIVVNDDSDEDIIQDCVCLDINSYKGQRENFSCRVGPQSAAGKVKEIVDVFKLFLNRQMYR